MPNKLEENLRAELNLESDPLRQDVLRLRLATCLASAGRLDDSRGIISGIRSENRSTLSPERQGWLNLVEAIVAFYSDSIDPAIEKARRCYAIASLARSAKPLIALCGAWLSHFYRNAGEIGPMIQFINGALENTDATCLEANGRLSLVLADSWLESGNVSKSEAWYVRSRAVARQIGDAALVGAQIYNRAAMHVSNARVDTGLGYLPSYSIATLELETKSALHHGEYYNIHVSDWLLNFLRAQLNMISGEYKEAQALLDDSNVATGPAAWLHLDLIRRADLLRCHLVHQSNDGAESELGSLIDSFSLIKSPADRLIISRQLLSCAQALHVEDYVVQLASLVDSSTAELLEYRENYQDQLQLIESHWAARIDQIFKVIS